MSCTSEIELLWHETLMFFPTNSWLSHTPDINPVDYRIWGVMQYTYRMCIERQFETWRTLQRLIDARCKALWTVLLINVRDFGPVWIKKNTLSTCSDTWAQVQISSVDKLDILFCVTVMTV